MGGHVPSVGCEVDGWYFPSCKLQIQIKEADQIVIQEGQLLVPFLYGRYLQKRRKEMNKKSQITLYVSAVYLTVFCFLFLFLPSVAEKVLNNQLPDAALNMLYGQLTFTFAYVVFLARPRSGSSSLYEILQSHPALNILEEPFNENFTRWDTGSKNYLEFVHDIPSLDAHVVEIFTKHNGIKILDY